MSSEKEVFLVNVTIYEGRHYAWPNMSSYVYVKVGRKTNSTKIRPNTDCPFYNEYFVFEFRTSLQSLLDKTITITVYKQNRFPKCPKILGYVNLDVATVWEQTDHQFFRKWAILSSPKSNFLGPRGYLKVTISILAKGQIPKLPLVHPHGDDELEGNLLLPEGITLERHRALYVFKVYKGVDIKKFKKDQMIVQNDAEEVYKKQSKGISMAWLEISFAGLTARTRRRRRTAFPVWNQSLTISELFPPLCLRIRLRLYYKLMMRRTMCATKYLLVRSIASDSAYGFLPTFGPSFVHFYRKMSSGEEYVGKVLLALETKIFSDITTKPRCVIRESVAPILEPSLWHYETVFLFAAVLNVSFVNKNYRKKPISFEVRWGRTKEYHAYDTGEKDTPVVITPEYSTTTEDDHKYYIDFEDKVPCMHVVTSYPSARRRLYNSNLIEAFVRNIRSKIIAVESLFNYAELHAYSAKIETQLKDLFDYVSIGCRNISDMIQASSKDLLTNLDKEKVRFCLMELADIEKRCVDAYHPRTKRKSFKRAEKFYYRIQALVDHPQECWPDAFLWMRQGEKRISCVRIRIKDVVYSDVQDETGRLCGRVTSFYFRKNKASSSTAPMISKVDIFIWAGLYSQRDSCYSMLPQGYEPADVEFNDIPQSLLIKSRLTFSCRVHVYQGRFFLSYDYTGLSDFFARATIVGQSKRTKVRKGTLNPLWDQTLVFTDLTFSGTKADIENYPPVVLVEILDQDRCFRVDYVGCAGIVPVLKFKETTYSSPNYPPKLTWWDVIKNDKKVGEILATAELLEMTDIIDQEDVDSRVVHSIPSDIKPMTTNYRMEVMFWGLRDVKHFKIGLMKPSICIECAEYKLWSEIIHSANPSNFIDPIKILDIKLPNQESFIPSMNIKLFDCKLFGHCSYMGNHTTIIQAFLYSPMTKAEWMALMEGMGAKSYDSLVSQGEDSVIDMVQLEKKYYEVGTNIDAPSLGKKKKKGKKKKGGGMKTCFGLAVKRMRKKREKRMAKMLMESYKYELEELEGIEDEMIDWWTKYYASIDESAVETKNKNFKLKIYSNELEKQSEFSYLSDVLTKFKIIRGKTMGDEFLDEEHVIGVLKGRIKIYKWPPPEHVEYITPFGYLLSEGFFQGYPSNSSESYLLRVYCIRGLKLRPKDKNGKCDPYLVLKLGDQVINDKKNHAVTNVSPIIGRCFEFKGTFPKDHTLTITVMDWDRSSADDLIGSTKVDVENRMYTRHRAHCGLQYEYKESGPTPWRDRKKPTQILEDRCERYHLPAPEYIGGTFLRVACKTFTCAEVEEATEENLRSQKENLALDALHHWHEMPAVGCHLVPEYVETRSLFHPDTPGIEQGKLQIWIDLFPATDIMPPDKVNVRPRAPIQYELRVIVWDTEDVILNEVDFFGDKKSDIFVKGWIGNDAEAQYTDIHYRSLTGEGNFNWRFIFNFSYLTSENKIIERRKGGIFDLDETEVKVPCRLKLQVWDSDIFTHDDFLGALTMDLNKIIRGVKSSKLCSLKMFEPNVPTFNLFKVKRYRGWWPFTARTKSNELHLTGKVDVELILLTEQEASASPAGLGRDEPNPLSPPKRPQTSFAWFTNPWKTFKFIIWKNMKWKLLKAFLILMVIAFVAVGVYNIPGYSVKKFFHV